MDQNKGIITRGFGTSDIGQRKNNEDSFLIKNDVGLYIIADGMGGLEKGEFASFYASKKLTGIIDILCKTTSVETTFHPDDLDIPNDPTIELLYGICEVNAALHEESKKIRAKIPESRGLGTTIACLLIRGGTVYFANVGDSRIYHVSQGKIEQVSHDHSVVAEMVRSGEITPEKAKLMKKNVLRRAMGTKEAVEPDTNFLPICVGDRYVLCTDGLSNMVEPDEILKFAQMSDLRVGCEQMVELAKDRGGRDNITAIVVEIADANVVDQWKTVNPDSTFEP